MAESSHLRPLRIALQLLCIMHDALRYFKRTLLHMRTQSRAVSSSKARSKGI